MIWYFFILIFTILTCVSFWNYKKSRGQGELPVQASATLLTIAVILSWIFPSRPTPEAEDTSYREWVRALGEVMGQRASQLLPQGGDVLVFTWSKSITDNSPREKIIKEAQLEGLQKGLSPNITTRLFDAARPSISMGNGMLIWSDLQTAMNDNPNAQLIINFLPIQMTLFDDVRQAGATLPKIVATGLPANYAEDWVKAGWITVAFVPRREGAGGREPSKTAEETVSRGYQVLTSNPR